ncbi:LacI family DNA-binding transcriptional regulator [Microbacterium koreense]|uniref:LacI family DNA-binding transcriptional regulator n=1 Tax=Microbacterium koreense TaxID=323761 RepID=A0ABW2ZMN3_9MICO
MARLAGVSPVTVSRTLAGGKNVTPEVQQRVIEAVRQLDYLPNENARGLRPGQHSGLIGVAITNLSNPFYGTFALGVEEIAHARGRYILLGSTGESASRESDLIANFLSRRVEGLIVIPAGEPAPRRWVRRLGQVPIVVAAREAADLDADRVLMDDAAMARRAADDLLAEGHQRVAFIGNIVTVSAHRARYEELGRAMGAAGLRMDPRLVRGVTDDVEDAASHARDFLDIAHQPTAIIAANNRIGVGVLREYARRLDEGVRADALPLVAVFDELELGDLLRVRVRAYASDPRELGRTAARTLFERLDGVAVGGPRRLMVPA